MKKNKIIESFEIEEIELTGRRKVLFENMRKLYPKGNPKMQYKMCYDLTDDRVDYYINYVFIRKKKRLINEKNLNSYIGDFID
jgi:hypothetical protein